MTSPINLNTKQDNLNSLLEEYADTIMKIGLQVKPGSTVVISSPVDCAAFARICTNAAYDAGASNVVVGWGDEEIENTRINRSDEKCLDNYPTYLKEFYNSYSSDGALFLSFYSPRKFDDKNIDRKKLIRYTKAKLSAIKPFNDLHKSNKTTWCVVGVPNDIWAKVVFPKLDTKEAVCALWNAILDTCRVNGDGKSSERWLNHLKDLNNKVDILNNLDLISLHYTNNIGSDFVIKLPENHVWSGADATNEKGNNFVANMPTEEIFTAPNRTGVNGTIVSSKPLLMDGATITGLKFIVKDGKIVEEYAETGLDAIKSKLDTDKGARYFGEVALVPYDSPISNSGIIFTNTLFDENASCHLAFGHGFPESIHGGQNMTPEELEEHGVNHSDTHVDFMVGTSDLSIIGTTKSGETVQIFKDGNFAI